VDVDLAKVDSVSNLHIQPIFFLEDANDDEIAAYIDLIIAAINANLKRHMEYLRNPSSQLQQEIRKRFTSIATAENCTNVHIQRIIRNFTAEIHYDAIMFDDGVADTTITIPTDIAVTPGVEFRGSDLSDEDDAEYTYLRTDNGIDLLGSGPDGTIRTSTHYPSLGCPNLPTTISDGIEIEIANDRPTEIEMEQTPNEIEIAHGRLNENEDGIEIAHGRLNGIDNVIEIEQGIEIAHERLNGIDNVIEIEQGIEIAHGRLNGIENVIEIEQGIDIAQECTNGYELGIAIAHGRLNGIENVIES
jgi:hypothetical protein